MSEEATIEDIEQLRAGGKQALADLFLRHRHRLVKMIDFRLDALLLGRLDVADVLQDAYLMASRRLSDYLRDPAVPVFVWLRTMTQQVLADTHRRHLGAQKRDARRDIPLHRRPGHESTSASIAARLAGSLTSPSKAAARQDMREHLHRALDQMDALDREVLALRHFEDLTNGEVAAVLGLQKAAASNRYVRALKRLKQIMEDAGVWDA